MAQHEAVIFFSGICWLCLDTADFYPGQIITFLLFLRKDLIIFYVATATYCLIPENKDLQACKGNKSLDGPLLSFSHSKQSKAALILRLLRV